MNHWDVRRDLAIHQPTQHRPGAIGRICDDAFRVQIEGVFDPVQHGARGPNLGLPDQPCGFNVDNDTMVPIFFGCGVLFVLIGFNQTGIRRKALAAHETVGNASCHGRPEQMA